MTSDFPAPLLWDLEMNQTFNYDNSYIVNTLNIQNVTAQVVDL